MRWKEEGERGEEEEERGGVEEDVDTQVMLMKRRIRFHFMNPFEKWAYRGRRRFPWKLLLQLLNVVLVVTQVSDTKVMQYKGHAVQRSQRASTQPNIVTKCVCACVYSVVCQGRLLLTCGSM